MQAARSSVGSVELGFPQGGPMSPVMFRDYSCDIPLCIIAKCLALEKGELEDQEDDTVKDTDDEENTGPITKAILSKPESERTQCEKWDMHLSRTVNRIEWRREKNWNRS